jgi:hypothetical protein
MQTTVESGNSLEVVRGQVPGITAKANDVAKAVVDEPSYQAAATFLTKVKGFRKQVEEAFGPVVKKAHEAWKAAVALRKQVDDPLDEAEFTVKRAMGTWFQESERKRKQEQERLAAEAKKRQEDDVLAKAGAMEKAGNAEGAEAIINAPVVAPAVVLPKAQAAGISTREVWSAEVYDKAAFLKGIVEEMGRSAEAQALELVIPNMTALNGMARALKSGMSVPGVRAVKTTSMAARAS